MTDAMTDATTEAANAAARAALQSRARELRAGRLPGGSDTAFLLQLTADLGPHLGSLREGTLAALHPQCWASLGWDVQRGCAIDGTPLSLKPGVLLSFVEAALGTTGERARRKDERVARRADGGGAAAAAAAAPEPE